MGHVRRLVAVALPALVAACSSGPAETSPSTPSASTASASTGTTPYTGPATELAPSQIAQPTVAEPAVPGRCAAADIDVSLAADLPPGTDVVVVFTNAGDSECEIDLGTPWARAHEVEPSVRLRPGGRAELWGVAGDPDCADRAGEDWELTVNGVPRTVDLPAGAGCDLAPTAFFPN